MFKKNVFMRIFGDDGIHGGTGADPWDELNKLIRKYDVLFKQEQDLYRKYEVLLQQYEDLSTKNRKNENKLKIALLFINKLDTLEASRVLIKEELESNDFSSFDYVSKALRDME